MSLCSRFLGRDFLETFGVRVASRIHEAPGEGSDILVTINKKGAFYSYVIDYECLIGVVETRFFIACEILQACKGGNAGQRPKLFTKTTDVTALE